VVDTSGAARVETHVASASNAKAEVCPWDSSAIAPSAWPEYRGVLSPRRSIGRYALYDSPPSGWADHSGHRSLAELLREAETA
jgi:hypothetical protein